MKTQIVYVVVSSDEDMFLEELWASVFSLRLFHPEATVKVLADAPTVQRIHARPALDRMITDVMSVPVPEEMSAFARSRVIKTTIRNVIDGAYLYIDTDTIITHSLEEIDAVGYDIAAVPDAHQPFRLDYYRASKIARLKDSFNLDISDAEYFFNGGVLYVADNELTRRFYQRWYENWRSYLIDYVRRADQPPLVKTDKEFGYVIRPLADVFNCQLSLSVRFLHDAYIVHFIHMDFISDHSYSPFMSGAIYREIKAANAITPHVEELIRHCKSSFETPSIVVGKSQIGLLFSATGQALSIIRERNKTLTSILDWLSIKIIKYYRAKQKIKVKLSKK